MVRNPYDKVVSYFWHDLDRTIRAKHRSADFASVPRAFTDWTKLDRFPVDAQIYVSQGDPVVDDFIRYERLSEVSSELRREASPRSVIVADTAGP